MTRLFCLVVVAVLSFTPDTHSQRQIDPEIERQINEFINDVYLPAAKVTTLSLSIVQNDGEVFYTNGYGWANEEKQIQNSNSTLFMIGSVSKSFTAVALMKILNEKFPQMGEAVLDTPIRKLIPEYNFTMIDRFRSEHATIRDLLAHRLCLPRTDWVLMADAINTPAEIAYRQRYNEEVCGVRTQLEYQNQIYVLAGELLSLLTSKPYEEAVEGLMREMGMERSRLLRVTDDFENTPEIARPYGVNLLDGSVFPVNPQLPLRVVPTNAAGGVISSANEMSRYIRFHTNLGNLDGKQIVPREVMEWTRKPAIHVPPMFGAFAYGQGLFISQYKGHEFIHHGGDFPPYHSLLSIFPTQNLTMFSSTNQGPLMVDRSILHLFIFEILNGATFEEAKQRVKEVADVWQSREATKKKDQADVVKNFVKESVGLGGQEKRKAEELVGKYGSGAAGDAEIIEKWNNATNEMGLYINYGKWVSGFLEYVEGPVYLIKLDTDMVQDFFGYVDVLFLRVVEDIIEFVAIQGGQESSYGKFRLGVSLDTLPPIPWLPGSC